MKKKLLGFAGALLALTATFCLAPGGVALADEAHTHCICGGEVSVGDHTAHTDVTWTAWNDSASLPATAGNYYLMQNVTLSGTWEVKADINLCLNGKNITGAAGANVISVVSDASLAITDCQKTVGKITHNPGATGRGIYNGGNLTLWNGSIAGNSLIGRDDDGGGVWNTGAFTICGGSVAGNSTAGDYGCGGGVCNGTRSYDGTFTMCGGSIENNSANGAYAVGGGVYTGGDVLHVDGKLKRRVFTMSGTARISGNKADGGGGVWVANSTAFTMSGMAVISENTSSNAGGIATLSGCTFDMYDSAAITGNTATGGVGGVDIDGCSIFTMHGGAITYNSGWYGGVRIIEESEFTLYDGSIAYNSGYLVGGVYIIGAQSKFIMSGGSIEQNTATGTSGYALVAGGVLNECGSINLSGNVKISGNVLNGTITDGSLIGGSASNFYLSRPLNPHESMEWPIIIEDDKPLAATARIGITAYDPSIGFAVVTGTTDITNFFSDEADYDVVADAANDQLVLKAHSEGTELAYDENGHWYRCANVGCEKRFSETAHTYDKEVASEEYLKSAATCTAKAVYYKSCVCGAKGTETFNGTTDPSKHTGAEEWSQTATTHEKKWTCCGAVTVASEPHNWESGTCSVCGYVCEHKDGNDDHVCDYCDEAVSAHSGGTAACSKKAVCEICGEEYGELDPANHENLTRVAARAATTRAEGNIEYWHCADCDKYFSDAAGTKEISLADTVIAKKAAPKKPEKKTIPKTGDDSTAQAALLLTGSLSALGAALFTRRRAA